MSRSKRDILDTEKMLERLAETLLRHRDLGINTETGLPSLVARADAKDLRRISMTLHAWHELECGTDRGAIERDEKTGKPYWFAASYQRMSGTEAPRRRGYAVSDREAGAVKRLNKIMSRYPTLGYYIQGDPRGCALYILRPGDVPEGEQAAAYYSRGLAVHK